MAELCQRVLYRFGMSVEWALSIVVPTVNGKGDIRNCTCYRATKLLEHAMKVVRGVLKKDLVEKQLALRLRTKQLKLCLT